MGGGKLHRPDLIRCQRRCPYSEKRIVYGVEEGINLFLVIARPQTGAGKPACLDPLGEHGAVSVRIWRIAPAGVIFGHCLAIPRLRQVVTAAYDQKRRVPDLVAGRGTGCAAGGRCLAPGAELSCQPGFGLIEEGIDLFLVIARPQMGGGKLHRPDLVRCQRRFPYSEKRLADGVEEGINLFLVVPRPQTGNGKSQCLDPLGEHGVVNVWIWRRFWALLSHAGATGRRRRAAWCVAGRFGRPVFSYVQQIFDGRPGPAPGADLSSLSDLRPAFQTSHRAPPGPVDNPGWMTTTTTPSATARVSAPRRCSSSA